MIASAFTAYKIKKKVEEINRSAEEEEAKLNELLGTQDADNSKKKM
jgi:hypothetical protein